MTRRERRLVAGALGCLVVGALLLLVAEATALRAAGALEMVGFVVLGALAILTPEYLGRDPEHPAAGGPPRRAIRRRRNRRGA